MAGAWWYLSGREMLRARNDPPAAVVPPSDDTPIRHPNPVGASIGDENLVQFDCDEGSITAVFARDILGLTLSDGRQIELRQNEVVSEMLYHNIDGTIEFRGSDAGASFIEGGQTTYTNCIARI